MALGEPFAEQLRQLQAAWLKRAAQIKDSENSSVQAASAIPTLQPGAEAAEPNNQATPSRSTPRLVKAPSKSRPAHSTKKVASATNSVKKAKVTRILRRKQQALKTIKVVKAVPVAVRRPIETYPARKAELRTIRDKLKRIERNLGCTTLKCENKTKGG